jgi:hypothetical protein
MSIRAAAVDEIPRKPTTAATTATAPSTPMPTNTPRHPIMSAAMPATGEPSTLPIIAAASIRLTATCRCSTTTRSAAIATEIGNTPPATMPEITRETTSTVKFGASAPIAAEITSTTSDQVISPVLPNASASPPSTGCMIA